MKVLFIWEVDEKLKEHFKKRIGNQFDIELIFPENKEEETLINHANEVEVLVGWRPTQKLFDNISTLKYFINPGVGVQHLLPKFKQHFTEHNIKLMNSHGNAFATAQHGVAMLLSLCNRLYWHQNWMAEGEWRIGDKRLKSVLLKNRQVGLMGYGHVGKHVHNMLQSFNCHFHIYKNKAATIENAKVYYNDQLESFLKSIDVLFITLPSTEKTKHIINEQNITLLQSNTLLVNIGRGDVIEESALYEALKNKQIDSAAIDVWYNYKPEKDAAGKQYPYEQPFHKLDNVLLSPHRAASPFDDLGRWEDVIENIINIKTKKAVLKNIVDVEAGY